MLAKIVPFARRKQWSIALPIENEVHNSQSFLDLGFRARFGAPGALAASEIMFRTLRTKLLIGLTPLLAIMVGLGLWAIVMFSRLGNNIDVILKENYASVLAAEGMKEALERIDSALLFAIGGEEQQARDQFAEYRPVFERNLKIEQGNVTLPGEQEMADALARLYTRYLTLTDRFFALAPEQKAERTRLYFNQLLPTFKDIKREADAVLNLNQKNMEDESIRARTAAAASIRLMVLSLLGAAIVATAIALVLSRSILTPIRAVTQAVRAMTGGSLDQVVPVLTSDELGELAAAFNVMARTIREFRQAGTERLVRAQKTAQATIDSFPDPVVVVDLAGTVERVNPAARRLLGATPSDGSIPWVAPPLLRPHLAEVLRGRADYLPTNLEHAVCFRDDGQERFLLPRALAIRDDHDGLLGAALVLTDVTKFRLVDQLKSDMVSTVSHELKTPMTSIQMVVHLLLEEVVGPLTPKQVELLVAARQDSDRLMAMVNDLLDLTRIEQGSLRLDLQPVAPVELISEAFEQFETKARDAGVALEVDVATDLPEVLADRKRIGHVFDNLVGNALRHTEPGGTVRLTAGAVDRAVRLTVADTGEGISAEHLPHIFEKFYQVPKTRHGGGVGVGLGLAIVREIVASHRGQVGVTSHPGVGTAFSFTLPTDPPEGGASDRDGGFLDRG
jgi:PAS domain S-box-containing protein